MKIDPNANMEDVPIRFHAALELMKARMSDHAYSWSEHQGVAESALHAADQLIAVYNRSEQ